MAPGLGTSGAEGAVPSVVERRMGAVVVETVVAVLLVVLEVLSCD